MNSEDDMTFEDISHSLRNHASQLFELDRRIGLLELERHDMKERFDELHRVLSSKMVPLTEEEQSTLDHFIQAVGRLVAHETPGVRSVILEMIAGNPDGGKPFHASIQSNWTFRGGCDYKAVIVTSNPTVQHYIRASFQEIVPGPPPPGGQALKDCYATCWRQDGERSISYNDVRRVRREAGAAFAGSAGPGFPRENEVIYEELN